MQSTPGAFEQWLLSEDDQGADAARAALIHLLTLYTAALALPAEWSDELEGASEVERVSDAHMRKAGAIATACAMATAFFTFFGAQLVYTALTFDGEGSLGHVGMFVAAGLFPLFAFFFGGCTFLAWCKIRKQPHAPPPPDEELARPALFGSGSLAKLASRILLGAPAG